MICLLVNQGARAASNFNYLLKVKEFPRPQESRTL